MKIQSELCDKCGKQRYAGYCRECDSETVGGAGRIFIISNVILLGIIIIYIFIDLI